VAPALVLLYLGLKSVQRQHDAINALLVSNLRLSGEKLAKILFERGVYPAVASHDGKLIQATKNYVAEHNISREDFEFQFLYGIRSKTQQRLAEEGYRVRVYVPFGTHWLPYFYRRLRERKENVFFVLKNLFKK
jgi:proline dehydrogenase